MASNLRAVSRTKCRRDFASLEKTLVALRAHEVHTSLAISCCAANRRDRGSRTNRWRRNISGKPESVFRHEEVNRMLLNLDDPSSSVQGSSSGEIRSCTPFPGNELGEFVVAAADFAAAAVK